MELSGKTPDELGELTGIGGPIYRHALHGVVDLMDDELEAVRAYTAKHYPIRKLWSRKRDARDDLIEP